MNKVTVPKEKKKAPKDEESFDERTFRSPRNLPGQPLILLRNEHGISRKDIDPQAIKVMARLIRSGYQAFLVGGSVRDLLLGKIPKDFDIGTDALPEEVRRLFRNSRTIGRRFKLVHVFFHDNKIFEVSTLRANSVPDQDDSEDKRVSDNTFGDPQTDALRRDLTINGLFYDLSCFAIIDYVGGIEDLNKGIIRVIGVPEERFVEDPVRMIRAVRHAARTGFKIEENTLVAIKKNASLIAEAASSRVYEELLRELKGGYSRNSLQLLFETGLLKYLLPDINQMLLERGEDYRKILEAACNKIDKLQKSGKEVETAIIFLAVSIGIIQLDIPEEFPLKSSMDKMMNLSLAHTVDSLFKPLGVPNKDRDRMLKILSLTWAMIVSYVKGINGKGDSEKAILKRKDFYSALDLLKIYADDPSFKKCFEYWRKISQGIDRQDHERKSSKNHRRRRA